MNVPNLITLFRILLVPLLVIFLIEGERLFALIVFVLASASDGLDGFIARVFNQKTRLGAFIDPIADKLLLLTAYISVAILNNFPRWLAVLVVSRDVIILVGIGVLMLNNRTVEIKPLLTSKATTFFQLVTICFFLSIDYAGEYQFLFLYLVYLTAFFTLVSGFFYISMGFRILGHPQQDNLTI